MRWSFSKKLYICFSAIAVGVTAGSLLYFYTQTKAIVLHQMGNRLKDIGKISTYLFTDQELGAIENLKARLDKELKAAGLILSPIEEGEYRSVLSDSVADEIMKTSDFQSLVSLLRKIKQGSTGSGSNGQPTIAYATLLITVPASPDRAVLQFISDADYDKPEAPNPVGNLFHNNSDALRNAFDGAAQADPDFRFEQGETLFSGAVPVFGKNGEVTAILALDYDAESQANQVKRLRRTCLAIVCGSLLLSVLVAYILARILHRPIRILQAGAEQVSKRDFETRIVLTNKDEFGLLASTFNSMVDEIRSYATGLEAVNRAYARFVPREFLEQLGQDTITKVSLGDQIQKQMTVLFSDIRSFTSISEMMSPRDNFDFINNYLKVVSPVIRDHGGFIDKYIGDAVMALFPNSPDGAVRAAIAMQKAVVDFNKANAENGRPPIRIGIGLHRGNLMLGTVGEEQRMDGTVISDAVNLASRLEGVTKDYGAGLIISESVYEALSDKSAIHVRYLGQVVVKGKKNAVKIYEVLEAEEEDAARRKIISAPDFDRAVRAFESNKILRARRLFRKVVHLHRGDVAALSYLEKCRKLEKDIAPAEREEERKRLLGLAEKGGRTKAG